MKSVVFVHGAWMTPACWSGWQSRFAAAGFDCHAPAWPGLDADVAALREEQPEALAEVGLPQIVDHMARVVSSLDSPVLVGHSFGGLIVQLLLDRGLGSAGVAIHPAPPRGVFPSVDALKASWPVVKTWNHQNKVLNLAFDDFCWGWLGDESPEEQRRVYDALVAPTPGRVFFQAATSPFHAMTKIDFEKERAPLLILAGGKDRTVTESMNARNAELARKSPSRTDYRAYADRTHFTLGAAGWESVADDVLGWIREATA